MLEAHFRFKSVENGLDDEAFAEQDLVGHGHEIVLHIPADAGDEMQASAPEFFEQFFADIALVSEQFPRQIFGDVSQHGRVGCVAGCDLDGHDLALVVDHKVQFKPVKPAHARLASGGHALEDLVTADAAVVADGELGGVSKIKTCLFSTQPMQQDHQGREQARHQADEAVVMGNLVEAGPILMTDAVLVKRLEVPERREVEQHHDKQHLRQGQLARPPPLPARGDQLMPLPFFIHFAEIIETAIQGRDIYRH